MGVYIKGIEMPKSCVDCELRLIAGCNPYKDNGLAPSKHRHRDCPLIEIPDDAEVAMTADGLKMVYIPIGRK